MRITRVEATTHVIPAQIPCLAQELHQPFLMVRVSTDTGITGWGIGNTVYSVKEIINETVGPFLVGKDPLDTERLWEQLWWCFNRRGQTGSIMCAISALDIALWDLKGKYLRQPVWRLLGGFRERVPAYVMFGRWEYTTEQLAEAARCWVATGADKLKLAVATPKRRWPADEPRPFSSLDEIAVDVERVSAVRQAVGDRVQLALDANYLFDYESARQLARMVEPYGIAWFEDPLHGNDPQLLRRLRGETRIPIASGQNEGGRQRFREFVLNESLDILQPNLTWVGGFTEALKVAHLAQTFNLPVGGAGTWPMYTVQLQAAVPNGVGVECHALTWQGSNVIFKDPPHHEAGWITAPNRPGLGLEVNEDALEDTRFE